MTEAISHIPPPATPYSTGANDVFSYNEDVSCFCVYVLCVYAICYLLCAMCYVYILCVCVYVRVRWCVYVRVRWCVYVVILVIFHFISHVFVYGVFLFISYRD